jgi:hypothetical protein
MFASGLGLTSRFGPVSLPGGGDGSLPLKAAKVALRVGPPQLPPKVLEKGVDACYQQADFLGLGIVLLVRGENPFRPWTTASSEIAN